MSTFKEEKTPVLKGNKVGENPSQDQQVLNRTPSGNKAVIPEDQDLNKKDNPYVKSS